MSRFPGISLPKQRETGKLGGILTSVVSLAHVLRPSDITKARDYSSSRDPVVSRAASNARPVTHKEVTT
jgi:hypothetical protein